MQFTRILTGTIATALAAVALAGCSGQGAGAGQDGAAPATTFRIAVGDPAGSSVANAAEHFAERVSELTDGSVSVEVFTDGTLFNGDQNAAVNLLGNGTLDATIISTSVYASFEPGMNAISLPYLFADMDDYSEFLEGDPGDQLLESLGDQGIAGLAMLTRTPRVTTNSVRPIESPEDFEGIKLRTPQNELWVKFFEALGAVPTPMDFTEVYTALQLGTIDGQENPLEVPVANKFFEVQNYLSMTNHISDAYVLGFNADKFGGLEEATKQALTEAAADTAEWKRTEDDAEVGVLLEQVEAAGAQVNELSPEALAEFQTIARDLYPQFESVIGGPEWMQVVEEYLAD